MAHWMTTFSVDDVSKAVPTSLGFTLMSAQTSAPWWRRPRSTVTFRRQIASLDAYG